MSIAEAVRSPIENPLRFDGDAVRIGETRLLLDTVVAAYREGETVEQMAADFGVVDAPTLYRALSAYFEHQTEFDSYLAKGEAAFQVQRAASDSVRRSEVLRRRAAAKL